MVSVHCRLERVGSSRKYVDSLAIGTRIRATARARAG